MASKMRSMRLSDERWAWLAEEAGRRGSSRTGVVEVLIDAARSGVNALSVPPEAVRVENPRVSSGPVRVDKVSDARQWALDRQAKLNEAKFR